MTTATKPSIVSSEVSRLLDAAKPCSKALLLVFGCLMAGLFASACASTKVGARTPPNDLLSASEAESIARREANRQGGDTNCDIGSATLSGDPLIRVVAQPVARDRAPLTNVFTAFLGTDAAERIARIDAQANLGPGKFTIQPAELLRGPFWRVLVTWVPASPGTGCTLYISAKTGEIVRKVPSM